MSKRLVMLLTALATAACSMLTVTQQHPAWQCDASYAGPLGSAIAGLITGDPAGIVAATSIAVNGCKAEASLVAGLPAQTTTTASSTTSTAKSSP